MSTLIISDLHIDTWDKIVKVAGKTKAEHFLDFLKVKAAAADALYVAGDLMDLPPVEDRDVSPQGSVVEEVLTALVDFAGRPDKRLIYLIGNHDIGLSGLRINYDTQIPWLGNLTITYPRVFIETGNGNVMVEHGHFYDPSLMLFAGDLMLSTYFGEIRGEQAGDFSSGLMRRLQRRDPVTGEEIHKAGDLKPAPKPATGCRAIGRNIINIFKRQAGKAVDSYTPALWRDVAPNVLAEYNTSASVDRQARTIVFGHTHAPDSATFNNGELYYNSGSWSGNGSESTYLCLDEKGTITIHDWIGEL